MMTATKRERLDVLRELLATAGYSDELVVPSYSVWPLDNHSPLRPDFVAFARPDQRDIGTSAIVASTAESEDEFMRWVEAAVAIAAPAALIALPDRLSLWAVGVSADESDEVESSDYESLDGVRTRLSALRPELLRSGKSSLLAQSSLFPLDLQLLQATREKQTRLLTRLVEDAILSQSQDGAIPRTSPRLVIGALAVLMIRDKLRIPLVNRAALVDAAEGRFPGYFSWIPKISQRERRQLDQLVDHIGEAVNFANLEPAMVSGVYEDALVTAARRREQGTYYTPTRLAHQLAQTIPFEHIPPDQRFVLDPTCGSGTMLLAAAGRLDSLQPAEADARQRHLYLTSHLRGYDSDDFATEISRLTLLMSALPIGNSWHIETRDALAHELSSNEKPYVMMANPPWRHTRSGGKRRERANDFVAWMVRNLQEDGFLAVILPATWLTTAASSVHREDLLRRCQVLDVWRLPEATFGSSAAAPCVLVAQKKRDHGAASRHVLVKKVSGSGRGLTRFLQTGMPDSAMLTLPGPAGEGLVGGPISRWLRAQADLAPLHTTAIIRSGCAHKPGRPRRSADDATHRELESAARLEAFGTVEDGALTPVRYPEDFHRVNQSDELIVSPKVLASAKRSSDAPWRIKVGLDLLGVVPRETLYMIAPRSNHPAWERLSVEDRLYAILAILGSGLVSCWVDEIEPKRNINSSVYRMLPTPSDPRLLGQLARAGHAMVDAVASDSLKYLHVAAEQLEEAVARVYRFPEEVRQAIARSLEGEAAPEGVVRYAPISTPLGESDESSSIPSFGSILDVGLDGIQVWVSGVTGLEGAHVPAPLRATGWLCSPGVDFSIEGNLSSLEHARYHLHVFDWLPEGEERLPNGLVR